MKSNGLMETYKDYNVLALANLFEDDFVNEVRKKSKTPKSITKGGCRKEWENIQSIPIN